MPEIRSGLDIREWRHRLGWTQAKASSELRIAVPSFKNIESGRKQASPTLLRLAELIEQLAAIRSAVTEPEPEIVTGAKIEPDVAPEPVAEPQPEPVATSEPQSPLTAKVVQALSDLSIEIPSAALLMLVDAVNRIRHPDLYRRGAHDESCRSMDAAREWRALVGKPGLEELAILINGFI